MSDNEPDTQSPGLPRKLLASWLRLSWDEQKTIMVILAIFLLGITARYWHSQQEAPEKPLNQPALTTK